MALLMLCYSIAVRSMVCIPIMIFLLAAQPSKMLPSLELDKKQKTPHSNYRENIFILLRRCPNELVSHPHHFRNQNVKPHYERIRSKGDLRFVFLLMFTDIMNKCSKIGPKRRNVLYVGRILNRKNWLLVSLGVGAGTQYHSENTKNPF